MVTWSSLFGGTGVKSVPGTGRGFGPPWPFAKTSAGAGAAAAVPEDSAAKPPAAAASTAPALKTRRREMSLTTSPKYSLSVSFASGWAHALPQRYSQVIGERPPAWAGNSGSRRSGTAPPWWGVRDEVTVCAESQLIPTSG
jgi:hypothetical protein